MSVTKVDLLDLKFAKSLFGYRPAEVESVLSEAADTLGQAAEENRRLVDKIRDMEKAMESLESREAALRQTLTATQKVVEDLKDNAREEARLIVEEAKVRAAAIIREANESVAAVNRDVLDLKHRRVEFEMGFRALLESHLRYLDIAEQGASVAAIGRTLSLGAGPCEREDLDEPGGAPEASETSVPDDTAHKLEPDGRD